MQITVFSTSTCPYCQMLKDHLKEKNIVYTDKFVDQDIKAKEEMLTVSDGYMGVPFTLIRKESGEEVKVVGFDKNLIDKALGLVQ